MAYLWLAAAAGARLAGRRRQIIAWALLGGLLGGAARASQPTLFRAENEFAVALVFFGLPAVAIGLAVGLVVRGVTGHDPR
jgi:hypothetical protein